MIIVVLIILHQRRIHKMRLLDLVGIQLAADQHGGRLGKIRRLAVKHRRQPRFGDLIAVAAGFPPAQRQRRAILFGEKAQRIVVVVFHKPKGIARMTNKRKADRRRPQHAQPAPAGGHGVAVVRVARGDQHPLFSNFFKHIAAPCFGRDLVPFAHSKAAFLYGVSLVYGHSIRRMPQNVNPMHAKQ